MVLQKFMQHRERVWVKPNFIMHYQSSPRRFGLNLSDNLMSSLKRSFSIPQIEKIVVVYRG